MVDNEEKGRCSNGRNAFPWFAYSRAHDKLERNDHRNLNSDLPGRSEQGPTVRRILHLGLRTKKPLKSLTKRKVAKGDLSYTACAQHTVHVASAQTTPCGVWACSTLLSQPKATRWWRSSLGGAQEGAVRTTTTKSHLGSQRGETAPFAPDFVSYWQQ